MILQEKLPVVVSLIRIAVKNRSTFNFKDFHKIFEKSVSDRDRYDTLDAASNSFSHPREAIYSSVMARPSTGLPGVGFFETFKIYHNDDYLSIAGDTHPTKLSEPQQSQMALPERERVYNHFSSNA